MTSWESYSLASEWTFWLISLKTMNKLGSYKTAHPATDQWWVKDKQDISLHLWTFGNWFWKRGNHVFSCVPTSDPSRLQHVAPNSRPQRCPWEVSIDHKQNNPHEHKREMSGGGGVNGDERWIRGKWEVSWSVHYIHVWKSLWANLLNKKENTVIQKKIPEHGVLIKQII